MPPCQSSHQTHVLHVPFQAMFASSVVPAAPTEAKDNRKQMNNLKVSGAQEFPMMPSFPSSAKQSIGILLACVSHLFVAQPPGTALTVELIATAAILIPVLLRGNHSFSPL